MRCLVSSLDAYVRREGRSSRKSSASNPSSPSERTSSPRSLSKILNDVTFLENEIVQSIFKKSKDQLEKMVAPAILEFEGLGGVRRPKGLGNFSFFYFLLFLSFLKKNN